MRVDGLYVRATGVRLPARLAVSEAVACGDCPPLLPERTGFVSVAVSQGESAAEMAVHAARSALQRAGSAPDEVDLILHADTYYQGHDAWATASYIQGQTLGNQCLAVEIRQMSNGGMAALDLAAAYLMASPARRDALLTAADRYCPPGFDRWRTDAGTPYADGGSALVLSSRGGFARLRSLASFADPDLEPLHRGDDPFGTAPLSHRTPIDFADAIKAFNRRHGLSFSMRRMMEGQQTALKHALADADLDLAEAEWVILPNFGNLRLDFLYYQPFGIDPARTTWEWARTVGHLGAADQFAALDHLVSSGRARPGERCVLVGVGAGYTWSCAVLEILEQPSWATCGDDS